ncbi:MAG: L-serine ammonia-lyase, iron-sulfur-dependent, subunit alpha [Sulfurospirillaceae bacterium]|nr:L-serine ammonia-lyase, iron-sulfur-dependent, subunit alpha [Sulfurospirillaceae bacterium]
MNTENILKILKEEIVPAQGCTEPIALAYVCAKAVKVLKEKPENITIEVSGNMIKNVKSAGIPNSNGLVGIEAACAMGAIAGDATKELMVISKVTADDIDRVKEFLAKDKIEVIHAKTEIPLYAKATVYSKDSSASVEIKHLHTNITKIEKNGKTLINRACNDAQFNTTHEEREKLSVKEIYELAQSIDINLIKNLFDLVIKKNSTIAQAGLDGEYGVNIGCMINKNIEQGFYGDDQRNRCASFASAGGDARMSGCSLPVMTTSGSGNQGMAASLPIIKYCKDQNIPYEMLIRTLFFSHLTTIHLKSSIGRLSAFCGVICATSAVSGALAFVQGGDYESVSMAITNSLGNISGVICDGAKASCAMKIATGVYTAFDSSMLALSKRALHGGDGIVGQDIEDTIKNIGILANDGMRETDNIILEIMEKKKIFNEKSL